MDPVTIRILMHLLPYCESRSMIPVDLSTNFEGWIYDPNGSGIRFRDPHNVSL